MSYKPAVGQINLTLATYEDTTNLPNLVNNVATGPLDIAKGVTPLAITRYALYNRSLEEENFGLDDVEYLKYNGGFITQGNKIDIKKGNFTVAGNLTVENNARFLSEVNMGFKQIYNVARKNYSPTNTTPGSTNDFDAVAIGDVRSHAFAKGMIMVWSGTREDLYRNLPYWRLCAPPDSNRFPGGVENGVFIPNLEGNFVIGAGYNPQGNTDGRSWSYQLNYFPQNDTTTNINIGIGTTGGHHAWTLTEGQMPEHKHDVLFKVRGGQINLVSSVQDKFTLYTKTPKDGNGNWVRNPPSGWVSFSRRSVKISCVSALPVVKCGCTGSCTSSCCGWRTCFPEGTKISSPAGSISIENIKKGSTVYGFDHNSGEIKECKVSKTFKHPQENNKKSKLIKITHEGGDVTMTKNHWVYVESGNKGEDKKYMDAGDLQVGEYLITSTNSKSKILNIEEIDDAEYVYNFEVEDAHNYIANNVKVHNGGGKGKRSRKCTQYCGNCNNCGGRVTSCPVVFRATTISKFSLKQLELNEADFIVDKSAATGGVSSQDNVGNGVAHNNMPPYYVLAYIVYVGKKRDSYTPGGGPLI